MIKTMGDLALLFIAGAVIWAVEAAITLWLEDRAERRNHEIQEGEWE